MPRQTYTVSTIDQARETINGMPYTLDGIHGRIKVETWGGRTTISHEPSPQGKRTDAYQKMRAQLRDDWSTDLTWSERLGSIMYELGIRFPSEK